MAEVDRGMDVADMKKLLVKSKTEPVNVAVALNGKDAVMMLHKIKQPKAVSKDLESKFKDSKNPRWGTAFVDVDADPKLVILTLNRAASGMGQKLKKTLKGTGFSKVRIMLEDGTVAEDVGEEDEGEEGQAQQGGATPEQAATAPIAAQTPEQEGAETQSEQSDPAALRQRLIALVKDIATSPQERHAELKGLAAKAQEAIKAGDGQAASEAVDALEQALHGGSQTSDSTAPTTKAPQPTGANAQVLAKSRTAWVAARKRIEDEISKLHQAMTKHYEGHGFGADLDKVFLSKIEPILTTLDQSLAHKLDEVGKNTDPQQHQKLVGEAKQIIDNYESFLNSNPLIPQLDENPFVPLQIQKTLTATLEALKKAVR
ncbi:MAG TPA: hypothetical protein VE650_13210 [Acetobacteraceae bacterium]|nr:hypothetical protein [Acetobacteraceae bacterium]